MRPMTNAELSIQESLYPELTCFGCGPANPDGKTRATMTATWRRFRPR